MTRMTITRHSPKDCTIEYVDADTGLLVARRFTAPSGGGYVSEMQLSGIATQPCAALAKTGDTLRWSGQGELADLIRREYQVMHRHEARRA
jgi:hypothetical protein